MISLKRISHRLKVKVENALSSLFYGVKSKIAVFAFLNSAIVIFQYLYLQARFEYLNDLIPFFYTKLWGTYQLAPKSYIYFIPLSSLLISIFGLLLIILLNRHFVRYLNLVLLGISLSTNIILTYSLIRIIFRASVPFPPLVEPRYMQLVVPFVMSFLVSYFILPKFVDIANKIKLVTIPSVHSHPAMLLQEPSARGGGVFYAVLFLLLTLIFIPFNRIYLGFYLSIFMLAILSLVDDYQNTHPGSDFRLIENPFLRLVFMFSVVSLIVFSGITIKSIGTLSGAIDPFGQVLSMVITAIWIVWVLNVLSWSNGIDGQYCGIVGIASLIIAVLALRFTPVENIHIQVAYMAAISAGISFGFAKLTWHPSKIMWGFGATVAGLVISTLSILVKAKIITSILIILIPLIDAVVTVLRRIIQGKNPLRGDRGHLHHLLINKGWSIGKIAFFYWITTAVFGLVGLLSTDKYTIQAALFAIGVVAFFIILLNLSFYKKK